MTGIFTETTTKPRQPDEGAWLFLRRWMAHPVRIGSIWPSSRALCKRMVKHGWPADGMSVLELGAGTGVISRAFLEAGLPADRLVVVELDPNLARHLRKTLPGVTVIEGDAANLEELLPERFAGKIGSVVCGIPLVLLPVAVQRRILDSVDAVAPGLGLILFSYCATSPLHREKLGLTAKREAWTPFNLPPASVWRYQPAG